MLLVVSLALLAVLWGLLARISGFHLRTWFSDAHVPPTWAEPYVFTRILPLLGYGVVVYLLFALVAGTGLHWLDHPAVPRPPEGIAPLTRWFIAPFLTPHLICAFAAGVVVAAALTFEGTDGSDWMFTFLKLCRRLVRGVAALLVVIYLLRAGSGTASLVSSAMAIGALIVGGRLLSSRGDESASADRGTSTEKVASFGAVNVSRATAAFEQVRREATVASDVHVQALQELVGSRAVLVPEGRLCDFGRVFRAGDTNDRFLVEDAGEILRLGRCDRCGSVATYRKPLRTVADLGETYVEGTTWKCANPLGWSWPVVVAAIPLLAAEHNILLCFGFPPAIAAFSATLTWKHPHLGEPPSLLHDRHLRALWSWLRPIILG